MTGINQQNVNRSMLDEAKLQTPKLNYTVETQSGRAAGLDAYELNEKQQHVLHEKNWSKRDSIRRREGRRREFPASTHHFSPR